MSEIAKVWDKDAVQHLIATNDKALARALWVIFQRQTAAEQSSLQTIVRNGRGFTGVDAEFLSDVARKLPRYSFNMTGPQIRRVRPLMRKYWRQLLEEIEAKGGPVSKKAPKRESVQAPNDDFVPSPIRDGANPLFGAYAM